MKKKQRPFAYPLIAALLTLPSGVYADAAPDIVGVEQTVGEPMAKALKALEKSTGYRIRFAYDDVKDFKAQAKPDTKDIRKALGQVIGNLPLQGMKLFVSTASSRSRFESIIRQPVTPTALQPKPMHIVSACLPHAWQA